MAESYWLKCQVQEAGFKSERLIEIPERPPHQHVFVVPKDSVRVDQARPSTGSVRVDVFQTNASSWAVMPNEQRDVIPVRPDEIAPR